MVVVGVALELITDEGSPYYRWALAAHKETYATEETNVYQITDRNSKGDRVPWWTVYSRYPLYISNSFLGVVHVGDLEEEISMAIFDDFMRQFGANQDGYDTRGCPWGSAMYVCRVLEDLAESGLIDLPCPKEELYLRIIMLGARLEVMAPNQRSLVKVVPLSRK